MKEIEKITQIDIGERRCERASELESHIGETVTDLDGKQWLLLETDSSQGTVTLETWNDIALMPATHVRLAD